MDSNRLTTSVQLLPALFGDLFGSGWDLLGRATAGIDPTPLGITGLLVAQLAIVLARSLAGASVIALASRCRHVRMPGCPRTR
jgi:hypothetical protein